MNAEADPSGLSSMVRALQGATHFEEAAAAALRPMLEVAQRTLEAGRSGDPGRFLRALVHLRPNDGYRRLWTLESGGPAGADLDPVPLLAAATAWRHVAELRCAVSIDVNLGTLAAYPPGGDPVQPVAPRPLGSAFKTDESRQRFLGRHTTHACAFPLRGYGGAIEGMVSLEASCPAAIGRELVWRECAGPLQTIADVAAPYLLHLPPRPVQGQKVDELLPVVGATISGLLPLLRVFAQQEETLLLSGPTGAGKSRLARWCHVHSARQAGPFEVLDLVTVPEDLQMAELFGWKKGAFTGAARDTPGAVARAGGGTLFIDEIDKLSLRAQAGMLHVLEERRYRTLGEGAEQVADVRFTIGTNANLQEAVRAGRFREDLYYRINVFPIQLPPLDERRDEIPLWAAYMTTRRHQERAKAGSASVAEEAVKLLASHPWPGNLRQLDNVIRRAYTLALVGPRPARPVGDVVLTEAHVAQALDYEAGPGGQSLPAALIAAATAFVQEAERHRDAPLDLDLADAFRGLVLAVASQRHGRDEALRLFNRENAVKSRNQSRLLKRDLEKVEGLYAALGQQGGSPFAYLLESDDDA